MALSTASGVIFPETRVFSYSGYIHSTSASRNTQALRKDLWQLRTAATRRFLPFIRHMASIVKMQRVEPPAE